jgi:hypothetical protein
MIIPPIIINLLDNFTATSFYLKFFNLIPISWNREYLSNSMLCTAGGEGFGGVVAICAFNSQGRALFLLRIYKLRVKIIAT